MTQHTAAEFAAARFATHPDGRIAARVGSCYYSRWASSVGGDADWHSDEGMANHGWSPLDEARLPRVVTDEMVHRAKAAERWAPTNLTHDGLIRHIITAALSAAPTTDAETIARQNLGDAAVDRLGAHFGAAPTTDKDAGIDWFVKFQDAARRSSIHAGNAAYAEHMLQEALDFAALWKETARRAVRRAAGFADDARCVDDLRKKAVQEREDLRVALEKATVERNRAEATAERYGRTIDKLQARIEELESLTAREHLDAAWEAAHVPADRTIPANARYVERRYDGTVYGPWSSMGPVPATQGGWCERRLVDPPTPTRPEGAEAIEAAFGTWEHSEYLVSNFDYDDRRALADHIAASVRASEEEN